MFMGELGFKLVSTCFRLFVEFRTARADLSPLEEWPHEIALKNNLISNSPSSEMIFPTVLGRPWAGVLGVLFIGISVPRTDRSVQYLHTRIYTLKGTTDFPSRIYNIVWHIPMPHEKTSRETGHLYMPEPIVLDNLKSMLF
jgi:hypothetical protein